MHKQSIKNKKPGHISQVKIPEINSFRTLCEILQEIRETRSTNTKTSICAGYFRMLKHDKDLHLAARFIGEGAFDSVSCKRASVGSQTSATAAAKFCEIDYEMVFKPCRIATGSSSETIEKLMENLDAARRKRNPENISLIEMEQIFESLYSTSAGPDKQKILTDTWKKMTSSEIKFFIRILGHGSLRIGFETHSIENAIAEAFDQDRAQVCYAHMITGSIGETAVLAKNDNLDDADFRLFHPLPFMLASPVDNRLIDNINDYYTEEKFDGMRCQVHLDGERVKLFSRDLKDITHSFPDLLHFFVRRDLPPTVFDGEICIYKNQTLQPFQLLQKRIGLKKPGKKILDKFPALFIAYDLLYANGSPLFEKTLIKRRKLLEKIALDYCLPVSSQTEVQNRRQVEVLFNRSLSHGNEGLIFKKKESLYEYGQRSKSWLKVKKPGGTLDTVIMYAHAGSNKRGGTYSDFTLGISVKEDQRYEEEFIPIGKVHGGYTDDELLELNQKIKEFTVERFGPTLGLVPRILVEIEFDDIMVNKRTKAGYTLSLPKFRAIRKDLGPGNANTLKDVEQLYRKKIEKERHRQDQNPSFWFIDSNEFDF